MGSFPPDPTRFYASPVVLPVVEYCASVRSRSPHVNKVDTVINSALWIVTGCLKPTPVSYLPVLAGIAPTSLRRDAATVALVRKAQEYDWHILHKATTTPAPTGRLKSRRPFNKAAQAMLQSIPIGTCPETPGWQHLEKRCVRWLSPPASSDTTGTQQEG